MITSENFKEMLSGKRPSYLFMWQGMVQFWSDSHGKGPIVATSRQAAEVEAANLTKLKGSKVSIAKVGAVEGETLALQVATAVIEQGATGVFVTDDGTDHTFLKAPPVTK